MVSGVAWDMQARHRTWYARRRRSASTRRWRSRRARPSPRP